MGNDHFSYDKLEKPGVFIPGTFTVLFIDIVKFTKYGDNQAFKNAVRTLQNAIIDVFQPLEWDVAGPVTKNDAIMLPTGDGYGVAFETTVSDADILRYTADISKTLKEGGAPVRAGISKGPCLVYKDVNTRMNLTGWGIIDAERAMSCGTKNHILCTENFAKPFIESRSDRNLHKLGKYFLKGRALTLYNYFGKKFGNSSPPPRRKK